MHPGALAAFSFFFPFFFFFFFLRGVTADTHVTRASRSVMHFLIVRDCAIDVPHFTPEAFPRNGYIYSASSTKYPNGISVPKNNGYWLYGIAVFYVFSLIKQSLIS